MIDNDKTGSTIIHHKVLTMFSLSSTPQPQQPFKDSLVCPGKENMNKIRAKEKVKENKKKTKQEITENRIEVTEME